MFHTLQSPKTLESTVSYSWTHLDTANLPLCCWFKSLSIKPQPGTIFPLPKYISKYYYFKLLLFSYAGGKYLRTGSQERVSSSL